MRRGAERLGLIESRRALCCRPFWRISEEIYLIVWNRVYARAGGEEGRGLAGATGLAGSAGASRSR